MRYCYKNERKFFLWIMITFLFICHEVLYNQKIILKLDKNIT